MEYGIYLGVITRDAAADDNRVRVRVIPYMEGIPDTECPYWPFFFKDQMITGKAGDMVWVICGNEFDIGYVLGYANYCADDTEDFKVHTTAAGQISLSVPEELRQSIKDTSVELLGEELSFINIKATFWNDSAIHFIDRDSGAFYIAFKTGTLYVFQADGLKISLNGGQSKMVLNASGFSVKADSTSIQSRQVGLGLNPSAEVLVSKGDSGEEAMPSEYVKA